MKTVIWALIGGIIGGVFYGMVCGGADYNRGVKQGIAISEAQIINAIQADTVKQVGKEFWIMPLELYGGAEEEAKIMMWRPDYGKR